MRREHCETRKFVTLIKNPPDMRHNHDKYEPRGDAAPDEDMGHLEEKGV